MKAIYSNVESAIGQTPIVQISTYQSHARILVKLEGGNPSGSIKDRVAKHIIEVAESKGLLRQYSMGSKILECSGGSMANGLLLMSKNKYKCVFVVPDNYSKIKIELLEARGAEVIKADSQKGNDAHFRLANEIAKANPETHFFTNQLHNASNPEAHYLYTGPEIIDQLGGERIDYLVCGIGSGGTISGVGKALKEKYPSIKIIGVQPVNSDVVKGTAVKHRIQGWGVGLKPSTLNEKILDDMIDVSYTQAIDTCDYLNTTEGLFLGISSGANIMAAKQLASKVGSGKTIFTISADSGVYYADNYNEYRNHIQNIQY